MVSLPKLTVMLKYLVVSTTCFESAREPVKKLSTDPAPFAYKSEIRVFNTKDIKHKDVEIGIYIY